MTDFDKAVRPEHRATRVLLAEDDDGQRDALQDYLELAGYEVCSVESGTALLEVLAEVSAGSAPRPDIIITDLLMPGVPGINVVEELRAEGWIEPMIIISSFGRAPRVADRIEDVDNVYFLSKPFEPVALCDLVSDLTR
jgi:CheY-like chemotaxis protein